MVSLQNILKYGRGNSLWIVLKSIKRPQNDKISELGNCVAAEGPLKGVEVKDKWLFENIKKEILKQ